MLPLASTARRALSVAFHRHAMMSALSAAPSPSHPPSVFKDPPAPAVPDPAAPQLAAPPPPVPKAPRPRPTIRATKAAVSIVRVPPFLRVLPADPIQTPHAVQRLRALLNGPTPQLIRVGVRNKGCAGLSYHLDYVDKPEKFDEVVEQDGVRVLIDSKALFSIIGSEMDWKEDALRQASPFSQGHLG